MKFSLAPQHPYEIRSYAPGQVVVGETRYTEALLLASDAPPRAWPPQTSSQLIEEHFQCLLTLDPEIVVFGSGAKLHFPPAALTQCLAQRRIGLETMDTASACRTYNILLSEDRRVVAVLMMI